MSDGKERINNKQFRDILICVMWPATINYGSGILARRVGRDMWICGIISILTVLPFIIMAIRIGRNFPGKTVVEYSTDLLGTVLGKALGLLISIYFFILASSSITMYIQHLTGFLLPGTPFLVVSTLHIFIICYLIWNGYEVVGRTSVIAFAMAIIFYLLVFMACLPEIDLDRILPAFDSGFFPVLKSSIDSDSFVGFVPLLVGLLLPIVHDKKKAFSSAAAGLLIGGGFFVFYFVAELMVMGPQVVAMMRIASMDFVRSIQITKYLHRFESFMVALWYWSIMTQAGIAALCSLEGFMQTVKIKKKSPVVIIIFGLALVTFTYYIGKNDVLFLKIREYLWKYISVPIDFGVPLLLFCALGFKKITRFAEKKL